MKPTPEPSTSRATRSVPANRDAVSDSVSDAPPPAREPTLIGDASNAVGFLDAPGLDPDALTTAIHAATDALAASAILTVFNDHPAGPRAIEELCERGELTLIATIDHPRGGTTFTLRAQQ